jgi:hypothetical protein
VETIVRELIGFKALESRVLDLGSSRPCFWACSLIIKPLFVVDAGEICPCSREMSGGLRRYSGLLYFYEGANSRTLNIRHG